MRNARDNKSEKVGITLPISLVKQTDKRRGDIPRSTFIRKAVENYLKHGKIRWGLYTTSDRDINSTTNIG